MSPETDVFDPDVHLASPATISTFTFADLGFADDSSASLIAGSHPFPFLSKEGVLAYRRSIFRPEVVDQCARWLGQGTVTLRNVAAKSKFVNDLWSSPSTTAIVQKALGVPVQVIMPLEIGHTNIQIVGDDTTLGHLQAEPSSSSTPVTPEQLSYDPLSTDSVIPWHFDSYPYVCIIMLSDTRSMIGGHTYIKNGNGTPRKVEGPEMGTAVVLQGGRVEHLASRAFGSSERITTISSYRRAGTGQWDDSYLSNVRTYDRLPDLYCQWTLSRLQKMKEEIEAAQLRVRATWKSTEEFPTEDVKSFCLHLSDYSRRTTQQIVDPQVRDLAVSKFSLKTVSDAKGLWQRLRALRELHQHIVDATNRTAATMPDMRDYLLDWHQHKAKMRLNERGSGKLEISTSEQYFFPDELARQGLNEYLLLWLDQMGIMALAGIQ